MNSSFREREIPEIHEGEIWWHISEARAEDSPVQQGTRPVIIVSNERNNRYAEIFTGVPLTEQKKKDLPTHFEFLLAGRKQTALCEQILTGAKLRLKDKMGRLTEEQLRQVRRCCGVQIGLVGERGD